jgi:hypothetical protein
MALTDIAKKELADYYKEYRAKNKDKIKIIQQKAQQKYREKKKLEQNNEIKEELDPIKLKKREYNKRYYEKKKKNIEIIP